MNYYIKIQAILLSFLFGSSLLAQEYSITGRIIDQESREGVAGAVFKVENISGQKTAGPEGRFEVNGLQPGTYDVTFFAYGYEVLYEEFEIGSEDLNATIALTSLQEDIDEVVVENGKEGKLGMAYLRPVEGMAVYASKKNEVILMDNINANLATNNARQVYARIPGLNIWESDAAGLQLGIGGRGLSPKRTSNFNTRQNGYDISADAMGYPESYYTPPAEALERIEIVRGAASLQYGTQFGGMINFKLKEGPKDKKIELVSRQTVGSFGLFSSYNSLGGTVGKLNYYTYYQRKQGSGWRPNTSFTSNTAFVNLNYAFNDKLSLGLDFTHMDYLAQQPGGLSDELFAEDPSQSIRERNWFEVKWNVPALWLDYKITPKTKVNLRTFGLIAERNSLGYLGRIDRGDPMSERDLIHGNFNNWGSEARLIHHYRTFLQKRSVLLMGARYYTGRTRSKQGMANDDNGPDFKFLTGEKMKSSHRFPSANLAVFAENVIHLSSNVKITPGIRYEHITTRSKGYYTKTNRDFAGNVILQQTINDSLNKERAFILLGIGASYQFNAGMELYGNLSQNYRAINFNDLRIDNPNLRVDENLKDEKGYNAELGIRGNIRDKISFDASIFYLKYNDRISGMQQADSTQSTYRFQTNVGDSRSLGIETYIEADMFSIFAQETPRNNLLLFSNISLIDARYIHSDEPAILGKKVEYVPPFALKTGITFIRDNFSITCQYAYTHEHYSDATNADNSKNHKNGYTNAINGLIPSYAVMDLSAGYSFKFLKLEAGINNLANRKYFTFRASGYPGPGIIPSEPRMFYTTLQVKL